MADMTADEQRREAVKRLMASIPKDWRYRWCSGGDCMCLGCVNADFRRAGFSEEDHRAWMLTRAEQREPRP